MPKLNLITEPDKLHNENTSVLLINPAESVKHDFNERAKQFEKDVNVYMFEVKDPDDQQNLKWLIEIVNSVDVIIFDVGFHIISLPFSPDNQESSEKIRFNLSPDSKSIA